MVRGENGIVSIRFNPSYSMWDGKNEFLFYRVQAVGFRAPRCYEGTTAAVIKALVTEFSGKAFITLNRTLRLDLSTEMAEVNAWLFVVHVLEACDEFILFPEDRVPSMEVE